MAKHRLISLPGFSILWEGGGGDVICLRGKSLVGVNFLPGQVTCHLQGLGDDGQYAGATGGAASILLSGKAWQHFT